MALPCPALARLRRCMLLSTKAAFIEKWYLLKGNLS
jgi:hypothetical protein